MKAIVCHIFVGGIAMPTLRILVIGGDKRQVYLAKHLLNKGYFVDTAGLELSSSGDHFFISKDSLENLIEIADIILLPIPCCLDGIHVNAPYSTEKINIHTILNLCKPTQKIFAGAVSASLSEEVKQNGLWLYDYGNDEPLTIFNAVFTAEGAVSIAIAESETTIWNSNCLIVGYGRIGKALSNFLPAMGAKLTICARKSSDRAWISSHGYVATNYDMLPCLVGNFDYIFNTVPSPILPKDILQKCKQDVTILDLASKPGGVDFTAANDLGLKTIHALSLPGKMSPKTAAEFIEKTISQHFN